MQKDLDLDTRRELRLPCEFPPSILSELTSLDLGTVLDLGARNCLQSEQLLSLGAERVCAVDLEFTRPWAERSDLVMVQADIDHWQDWNYNTIVCMGLGHYFSSAKSLELIGRIAASPAMNLLIEFGLGLKTLEQSAAEALLVPQGFQLRQQWWGKDHWPARVLRYTEDQRTVWYTRG